MDKRTKVVERAKSLLIVLLACSAVLLASRTSLIRPLSDLLSPAQDSGGANVYRVPVQRLEMARPVAMAALIPGEPERMTRMAAQMSSVLYPDTPVRLELWHAGEKQAYFRLMNLKTGKPVLNRGVFEWK